MIINNQLINRQYGVCLLFEAALCPSMHQEMKRCQLRRLKSPLTKHRLSVSCAAFRFCGSYRFPTCQKVFDSDLFMKDLIRQTVKYAH